MPTSRRKVKSNPKTSIDAADQHERAKDHLAPNEVAKLLEAAKAGDTVCAITCCCS